MAADTDVETKLQSALLNLIDTDSGKTITELHDEVTDLRDEVKSLREIIQYHDHQLAVGGVHTRHATPDQRAISLRLQLYHQARFADADTVAVHWKEANELLGGSYYKAQCYIAMELAADGESRQGNKSKLSPAKGFRMERADERTDGWTKLVCDTNEIDEYQVLTD